MTPTLAWFGLIPLMVGNGIGRELVYASLLGDLYAHQVSTLVGVLLLGLYTLVVFPWLRITEPRQALRVGLLWVLLTLCFEFAFGHYLVGHSWHRLLEDYNLLGGRVWLLFLLAMLLAPWAAYRLRGEKAARPRVKRSSNP